MYLGTRIHSSKLFKPSCPSEPRPQENTCPLSFKARVCDSPHESATMICASKATTCSVKRERGENSGISPAFTVETTNLVSFWTSRVPAGPDRCSRRCTRSRLPAGTPCVCAHTRHLAPASRGRSHIFAAQPQSLRQSLPSRADRRRRFPSRAWSPLEKRTSKTVRYQ